jgi:hypothetical protein
MKASEFDRLVDDARDKASITGQLCEGAMRQALDEIETTHPRSRSAILSAMNFVAWALVKSPTALQMRSEYESLSSGRKYRAKQKASETPNVNQLDLFDAA